MVGAVPTEITTELNGTHIIFAIVERTGASTMVMWTFGETIQTSSKNSTIKRGVVTSGFGITGVHKSVNQDN